MWASRVLISCWKLQLAYTISHLLFPFSVDYILRCCLHSPLLTLCNFHSKLFTFSVVNILSCLHSPVVYIPRCFHFQLFPFSVVYIPICLHSQLFTFSVVYILSCLQYQLFTLSDVYILRSLPSQLARHKCQSFLLLKSELRKPLHTPATEQILTQVKPHFRITSNCTSLHYNC